MMREMDSMHSGPTQDWSGPDMGELAGHADADDEAFDRWLASMSPATFDRFLVDLHHQADALFEQAG